jgi:hypothetical protein
VNDADIQELLAQAEYCINHADEVLRETNYVEADAELAA